MKLSDQDAEHFFYLLRGLQLFANQKLKINPAITSVDEMLALDDRARLPIRNGVWEHPDRAIASREGRQKRAKSLSCGKSTTGGSKWSSRSLK